MNSLNESFFCFQINLQVYINVKNSNKICSVLYGFHKRESQQQRQQGHKVNLFIVVETLVFIPLNT